MRGTITHRSGGERSGQRPADPPARPHIASLDGLRGIAVLLVMVSHYAGSLRVLGVSGVDRLPFRFGWAGVDVFFALSGFLITGILLDSRGAPGFFRTFYARRVLRICPLYYLAILVILLLRLGMGADGAWGDVAGVLSPGSLAWPTAYLENVALALQGPSQTGILTHYWSLAVEEHFYLVWPVLIWACPRRWLTIVAVAAVAAPMVLRAATAAAGADPAWIMGLTPLRVDGLALGALASVVLRSRLPAAARLRAAFTVLATATAALAVLVAARRTMSPADPVLWVFGFTLVSAAAAALILVAAAPGPIASALSHPALRWFGKYSFGLYVWHPIIAVILLHSRLALVTKGQGAVAALLAVAFTVAVTLAVAWLSFHTFEQRFLALKRFFPSGGRRPGGQTASSSAGSLHAAPAAP